MHTFLTAQMMYSTINNPENILEPHSHACSRNTPQTAFTSACAASPITAAVQLRQSNVPKETKGEMK